MPIFLLFLKNNWQSSLPSQYSKYLILFPSSVYDFWWEVCCSSLFLLGKVTCIHPQLFSGFSFCPWFPAVWKWYANMYILWYFSCLVTPELPGPVVWHILLFLQCLWPLWKYLFCSVLYGSSGILNTHVGLFEILPQFLDVLFWFFFTSFSLCISVWKVLLIYLQAQWSVLSCLVYQKSIKGIFPVTIFSLSTISFWFFHRVLISMLASEKSPSARWNKALVKFLPLERRPLVWRPL